MRKLFLGLVLLGMLTGISFANEHIIVSGGPALRAYERFKPNDHDRYWGNFVDFSVKFRLDQIRARGEILDGDTVTWLVFRPAYERRGQEEKVDCIGWIEKRAKDLGVDLVWFSDRNELIDYVNNGKDRSREKISRFEFFGHSNKRTFIFNYSNSIDGSGLDIHSLHLKDIPKLRSRAFASDAYCQSWGCHSGEEFSQKWKKSIGVKMVGAVGKTSYANAKIPIISTAGGYWNNK
jgi:hypothetical protein